MVMAFVHPALAVPLLLGRPGDVVRRRLDGAALVAGTVGADVEYFARMSARPLVHLEPLAVLGAGVGGGLILLALLALGGAGMARALPRPLAARFAPVLARRFADRGAARIAAGLIVGAVLHLAWDSVTTRHGLLAAVVPWRTVGTVSTVAGVLVLVLALVRAPRVADGSAFSPRALVVVVAGGLVGAGLLALVRLVLLDGSVPDAMAAASAGALLGVAAAGWRAQRGDERT